MSIYKAFEYSDNLTSRVHSSLPNNLKVTGENDPEILLIIRLLSGNLEMIHSYTSKSIKSRINYFSGDLKTFSNWKMEFPKTLSDEVSADDISIFRSGHNFYSTKIKNPIHRHLYIYIDCLRKFLMPFL
jgi:hypothetical protein